MPTLPDSLKRHRVRAEDAFSVVRGQVRYSPANSIWFVGMASAAVVGGALTFSWSALLLFLITTATVLLLGHSLGSHRKLIHDSYQCPKWLEYLLVYCGVQVGLAGPLGLLRQHELRDYAQRLPDCHDFLRHGSSFWRDAWWQLHCELHLDEPPQLVIEPRIANDRFYRFLESTWRLQQLPLAVIFFVWGGWAFVFWGVCARVTAGVLGHWLIGYFAHNHGPMHYQVNGAAVQGRNIRFTSLLTMGESWHNNHHAYPGSARLGLFAGEWDPGWWMLMVLRKLGWVWDIRLPADLPVRAELVAIDTTAGSELQAEIVSRRPTVAAVLRLCRADRTGDRLLMEGPASALSAAAFGRVLGPGIQFRQDAAAPRLTLAIDAQRVRGLPALCVAMSTRNPMLRLIALCAAPLAVGLENTRASFDLA